MNFPNKFQLKPGTIIYFKLSEFANTVHSTLDKYKNSNNYLRTIYCGNNSVVRFCFIIPTILNEEKEGFKPLCISGNFKSYINNQYQIIYLFSRFRELWDKNAIWVSSEEPEEIYKEKKHEI